MNYDDASAREFALDTGRSVIVQAPAGSGKTTLLVSRYLRLLAQVDQPEQVLAITFTKKAAAEMRQRVLDAFARASPQAQAAIDRARELDWRIEAQPHRLKIQTIDGFAMGLVRRLPIGSGFGMDVGFLEDATPLYDQAVFRLFDKLNTSDPLAQTLADFLALLDNDYALARALLVSMLAKRDQWLEPIVAVAARRDGAAPSIESAIERLNAEIVADLKDRIAEELLMRLDALGRFAVQNRGSMDEPRLAEGATDSWRSIAALVTTQAGKRRRKVTVRDGFPAEFRAEKIAFTEVVDVIEERGLIPKFAILRALPDADVSENQRDALRCVSATLALAALELAETFRLRRLVDFTELTFSARSK